VAKRKPVKKEKKYPVELTYKELELLASTYVTVLTRNCKLMHMYNKKYLKGAEDVNARIRSTLSSVGEVYLPLCSDKVKNKTKKSNHL
jgi:hypothetical protein